MVELLTAAILGFETFGKTMLTLAVLVAWVGLWIVGPMFLLVGVTIGGSGGSTSALRAAWQLGLLGVLGAGGSTAGLWWLTRGETGLFVMFLLVPAALAVWVLDKWWAGKRRKHADDRLIAKEKREDASRPPIPVAAPEPASSELTDELMGSRGP